MNGASDQGGHVQNSPSSKLQYLVAMKRPRAKGQRCEYAPSPTFSRFKRREIRERELEIIVSQAAQDGRRSADGKPIPAAFTSFRRKAVALRTSRAQNEFRSLHPLSPLPGAFFLTASLRFSPFASHTSSILIL